MTSAVAAKRYRRQSAIISIFIAVRSIVFKLTKGDAPDVTQMNARVREMIADALKADGVEELFFWRQESGAIDIFDEDYLARINKIKLPATKFSCCKSCWKKPSATLKRSTSFRGSTSPAVSSRLWINITNAGKMMYSTVKSSILQPGDDRYYLRD
jgi:hypothetical protein